MKVYCVRFTNEGNGFFSTPSIFLHEEDAKKWTEHRQQVADKEGDKAIRYFYYEDYVYETLPF